MRTVLYLGELPVPSNNSDFLRPLRSTSWGHLNHECSMYTACPLLKITLRSDLRVTGCLYLFILPIRPQRIGISLLFNTAVSSIDILGLLVAEPNLLGLPSQGYGCFEMLRTEFIREFIGMKTEVCQRICPRQIKAFYLLDVPVSQGFSEEEGGNSPSSAPLTAYPLQSAFQKITLVSREEQASGPVASCCL